MNNCVNMLAMHKLLNGQHTRLDLSHKTTVLAGYATLHLVMLWHCCRGSNPSSGSYHRHGYSIQPQDQHTAVCHAWAEVLCGILRKSKHSRFSEQVLGRQTMSQATSHAMSQAMSPLVASFRFLTCCTTIMAITAVSADGFSGLFSSVA